MKKNYGLLQTSLDQIWIGEQFEEKMTRLTTELYGFFEESHALEQDIKKKLAAIGCGDN